MEREPQVIVLTSYLLANNYGDDGVPSKTDGAGGIVRLDGAKTATGKL